MPENPKLEAAIIRELQIPPDLSWQEVRGTIYPGKTLEEIWKSLWAEPPDVDDYLAGH